MSLARTALRLSVVEALRPSVIATSADYPTSAQGRVFDSRMDAIDDVAADERAPTIVVFTDDDDANPAQPGGGDPFERFVDLVFELSVIAFGEDPAQPDTFVPVVPVTDAQCEAALDILELQVRFVLRVGPTGKLVRRVFGSPRRITSSPARTSEEGYRLATRTMTVRMRIPDDCFDLSPTAIAEGTARLPDPLRTVIEALPAGSYGAAIGAGLGPFAPAAPVLPALERVGLNFDTANPAGVTDGTTDVAAVATPPQS